MVGVFCACVVARNNDVISAGIRGEARRFGYIGARGELNYVVIYRDDVVLSDCKCMRPLSFINFTSFVYFI